MYLRSLVIFALTITNSILAREISSRQLHEVDNSNDAILNVIEASSTPKCVDCLMTRNLLEYSGEIDGESPEIKLNMVDEDLNEAPRVARPGIGNPVVVSPTAIMDRIPLFEPIYGIHKLDDRKDFDLFRTIDSATHPQTELIDNTLRLMAIKASMEDLMSKLFPVRLIQHATENHK